MVGARGVGSMSWLHHFPVIPSWLMGDSLGAYAIRAEQQPLVGSEIRRIQENFMGLYSKCRQ